MKRMVLSCMHADKIEDGIWWTDRLRQQHIHQHIITHIITLSPTQPINTHITHQHHHHTSLFTTPITLIMQSLLLGGLDTVSDVSIPHGVAPQLDQLVEPHRDLVVEPVPMHIHTAVLLVGEHLRVVLQQQLEDYSDLVLVAQLHQEEQVFPEHCVLRLLGLGVLGVGVVGLGFLLLLEVRARLLSLLQGLGGCLALLLLRLLPPRLRVDLDEGQVVPYHLLGLLLELVGQLVDVLDYGHVYIFLRVVGLRIGPDQVDVIQAVLNVLVAVGVQLLPDGAEVHGALDDGWVVQQPELLPVHRLSERRRIEGGVEGEQHLMDFSDFVSAHHGPG